MIEEIIDPVSADEIVSEDATHCDCDNGIEAEAHDVQENTSASSCDGDSGEAPEAVQIKASGEGEELSSLIKELEREKELRALSENKLLCISLLEKACLPASLCDFLVHKSAEETQKRVESVAEIIKKAVSDEVSKRLATVPTPSEGVPRMTRAQFQSLSLSDMQKIYKSDKELYRELTKKR